MGGTLTLKLPSTPSQHRGQAHTQPHTQWHLPLTSHTPAGRGDPSHCCPSDVTGNLEPMSQPEVLTDVTRAHVSLVPPRSLPCLPAQVQWPRCPHPHTQPQGTQLPGHTGQAFTDSTCEPVCLCVCSSHRHTFIHMCRPSCPADGQDTCPTSAHRHRPWEQVWEPGTHTLIRDSAL